MEIRLRSLITRLKEPVTHSFNHVAVVEDLFYSNRDRKEAARLLERLLELGVIDEDFLRNNYP